MKQFLIFLFPFLFPLLLAASSFSLTLKSSDGRSAEFSGILVVAERGLFVSRGIDPTPVLIPWERLDLDFLRANHPDIVQMRRNPEQMGGVLPRGIYAVEAALDHPRAALYRILHTPQVVDPPVFLEFYEPRQLIGPNLEPGDQIHASRQLHQSKHRYVRLMELLFIREQLQFSHRRAPGQFPGPPVDMVVVESSRKYDWRFAPYTALLTLTTPQSRHLNYQSGPNVDLEFSRWTGQYLRRLDFFQPLIDEIEPLISATREPAERRELQRFHDALVELARPGAVSFHASEEVRKTILRYQLP